MHVVVLLPGNVFKCLFFVLFLLNKHQSWRDLQIQRAFLDWQESVQSVCPSTEQGDGAPNPLPPISEELFLCPYR